MHKLTFRQLLLSGLLALTVGCQGAMIQDSSQGSEQAVTEEGPTARIIVKFAEPEESDALTQQLVGERVRNSHDIRAGQRVLVVPEASAAEVLAELQANPNVVWAELDEELPMASASATEDFAIPNDPLYPFQTHHGVIRSLQAWSQYTQGDPNLKVVVCDTGVASEHEDLAGLVRTDLCANAVNETIGDCSLTAAHGTRVAGLIAAHGNNQLGGLGVSSAGAQIIPVKITSRVGWGIDGRETATALASSIAGCIYYAANEQADVINISFDTVSMNSMSNVIKDAAAYAEERGILTVVAGGNVGTVTMQNPYSILHVGATNKFGTASYYTRRGAHIDLVAPGQELTSSNVTLACNDANQNSSQDPGECVTQSLGYSQNALNGTSFAAPLVTGASLLLKAVRPDAVPPEIRCALTKSATDLGAPGRDDTFGAGLIQVDAALEIFTRTPTNNRPFIDSIIDYKRTIRLGVNEAVELSAFANDIEDGNLTNQIQWRLTDNTMTVGSKLPVKFDKVGRYVIMAVALDNDCLANAIFFDIVVSDQPPTIAVVSPSDPASEVNALEQFVLTALALDREDGDISSKIIWYEGAEGNQRQVGTGRSLFYTATQPGAYLFTARVSDSKGQTAKATHIVSVLPPAIPAAPSNFSLTSVNRYQVIINWTDNATNETAYVLERATVRSFLTQPGQFIPVATLPKNSTQYFDHIGLPSDPTQTFTYVYRLKAVNEAGASASVEATITVK